MKKLALLFAFIPFVALAAPVQQTVVPGDYFRGSYRNGPGNTLGLSYDVILPSQSIMPYLEYNGTNFVTRAATLGSGLSFNTGTSVLSVSGFQPLNSKLTEYSGFTLGNGEMLMRDSGGTLYGTTITTIGQSLMASANSAAMKAVVFTGGSASDLVLGDGSSVSLNTSNVPEGSNLYYTNARGIGSVLTGYTSGAGTLSASDTMLGAIQKLNGNIAAMTSGVSSVFGRTGAVTTQSGDYTKAQVTESGNLYFTNGRAVTALTGQNVSLFTNDSAYITASALSPYLTTSTAASTYQPVFGSQTDNTIYAAPSGSSGAPTFRTIVAADVPTLNQNTTGSSAKWTTARLLAGNKGD